MVFSFCFVFVHCIQEKRPYKSLRRRWEIAEDLSLIGKNTKRYSRGKMVSLLRQAVLSRSTVSERQQFGKGWREGESSCPNLPVRCRQQRILLHRSAGINPLIAFPTSHDHPKVLACLTAATDSGSSCYIHHKVLWNCTSSINSLYFRGLKEALVIIRLLSCLFWVFRPAVWFGSRFYVIYR